MGDSFTRVSSCIELVPDTAVLSSYKAFIQGKREMMYTKKGQNFPAVPIFEEI